MHTMSTRLQSLRKVILLASAKPASLQQQESHLRKAALRATARAMWLNLEPLWERESLVTAGVLAISVASGGRTYIPKQLFVGQYDDRLS